MRKLEAKSDVGSIKVKNIEKLLYLDINFRTFMRIELQGK